MSEELDTWLDSESVSLDDDYTPVPADADRLRPIDDALAATRIVFLGETNHFIREKGDFRLWWLRRLAAQRRPIVIAEELGWSDGRDVARYLETGHEAHLDALATFGDERHLRADRDDRPTGVLRASFDVYPTARFKAEQARFYRALRELSPARFFGFDIDAVGVGYDDLLRARARTQAGEVPRSFWGALERVRGESLEAEAMRLERADALLVAREGPAVGTIRDDLRSMIETLRYTQLAHPATDYEALRPAMAYREETLKRRVDAIIAGLAGDEVLVLMAHAFHLAKDDRRIGRAGVGPGGDRVASLGHYLVQERKLAPFSAWLVYGGGEDSQPFPDLPRHASFPRSSLNRHLAARGVPIIVPVAREAPAFQREVGVGHLYSQVVPVHLPSEVDALFFIPTVSPLRD